MIWLILGVVLWSVVHFYPSVAVSHRNQLSAKFGNGYQAVFALLIIASIVLMVIGWKNTIPTAVYNPPSWGRHATMLFILIAAAAAKGAKVTLRTVQPNNSIKWPKAELPKVVSSTAPAPNINTGANKGIINTLSNMPPFLIFIIKAEPTVPNKLNMGVAKAKDNIKTP